jgi:hypothetical protein
VATAGDAQCSLTIKTNVQAAKIIPERGGAVDRRVTL